jgi:hypothetical protein
MVTSTVQFVCGTLIILGVIASVVALAFQGTISGQDAVAILATIVTLGGGALAVHTGVNAGAKAANPPKQ